jgi:CRP-like cAMP-binding protein
MKAWWRRAWQIPPTDELEDIPLFRSANSRQLRQLARVVDVALLPAGWTLVRQGERVGELVIVVDGYIERRRHGRHVGLLHPGQWTDPRPLVAQARSAETLITASPARVALLGVRAFNAALDEVDGIGRRLLAATYSVGDADDRRADGAAVQQLDEGVRGLLEPDELGHARHQFPGLDPRRHG